jgi:hypothetical protein
MGDRANVWVREDGADSGVFLYTHWDGTDLPLTLREALTRGRDRWTDTPYLTRIIFCEMVRGNEMATTGYGISSRVGDGDDRVLEVNIALQLVFINGRRLSFEEYVELEEPGWNSYAARA